MGLTSPTFIIITLHVFPDPIGFVSSSKVEK